VFLPSAAFLYDVAGFSRKWLRDLAVEQREDGCVLNIVPDPKRTLGLRGPDDFWPHIQGSSGWGDAVVMVPWELYRWYDDRQVLEELWPAMVRWVEFAAGRARSLRFSGRAEARPEPAPHEQYLWDGGFHWGEWTEPGGIGDPFWGMDQGHVGTAFLHHSAGLLARIGGLLGRDGDAVRFDALAGDALQAWRTEYVADDGTLTPDTQAAHVRALAFDLVPDGLRAQTAARLVELIRAADTHLATGFLATPYLLPVLADTGHLDVAYELLLRDTEPSWLTMVARARDHGVGGLGRHRGRRHGPRVAEPLQQGCSHRVPALVRRRDPAPGRAPGVPALPHHAGPGRWHRLVRGGARFALRSDRVVVAARHRPLPAHHHRAARHDRRDRAPRRQPARAVTRRRDPRVCRWLRSVSSTHRRRNGTR
jgi:alpha-L-rhamnosidase